MAWSRGLSDKATEQAVESPWKIFGLIDQKRLSDKATEQAVESSASSRRFYKTRVSVTKPPSRLLNRRRGYQFGPISLCLSDKATEQAVESLGDF